MQQTHLTALNVIELNRCLLIAHRGYSQVAPENTLPAFRLALKAQCDLVEMDFHQTRDGQLIVIHDSELDRTTNARKLWKRKHIKVDTKTAAASDVAALCMSQLPRAGVDAAYGGEAGAYQKDIGEL